jgi:hypothetical protein
MLSSGQASLTSDVSGVLPVANGGTGLSTITGFPSGNGTAAMTARTMTGTANQIAVTNGDGVGGNPTFSIVNDVVLPGTGGTTLQSGTTAQRPGSPSNGLMRYNSTSNQFEFYQNGAWTSYASSSSGWSITGNASTTPGTNFIGTADNQSLVVKTNNTEAIRVNTSQMVGIGTNSPNTTVDIDGGLSVRPNAVSATSDNQSITVGNRTFIRITSNSTPTNRTVTLSNGLQDGQVLIVRVDGGGSLTNGVELLDSGNVNLSGDAQMNSGTVMTLIWDVSQWFEVSRSHNN